MLVILCVVGAMCGSCLVLGYCWARIVMSGDRHQLAQARAVLETELQALDRTRQVREIYLAASRDMEAVAHQALRHRYRSL